MVPGTIANKQAGVALVVALLFLLVVTLLAVTAARDSAFSLNMSGNLQDQYDSLQAAEAAAVATLALSDTADDPFPLSLTVTETAVPFTGLANNPLADLIDPNDVSAMIRLTEFAGRCPRSRRKEEAFDADEGEAAPVCDRYRIDVNHDRPLRARTQVSVGVVLMLSGGG